MKALSLWQPWASAVAYCSKHVETRSWSTNHRGPIAIHAAKSDIGIRLVMNDPRTRAVWRAVLNCENDAQLDRKLAELPRGALLCTAELHDCVPIERVDASRKYHLNGRSWSENDMGDYRQGRYGFLLRNMLGAYAIPCRGHQLLFDVPDNLLPSWATQVT